MGIKFRHKGLKALYETGSTKGVQQGHVKKLRRILADLEETHQPQDMDLPGYQLHELKEERRGTWSVKVNGNWRVTWTFSESDIEIVDYEDYH